MRRTLAVVMAAAMLAGCGTTKPAKPTVEGGIPYRATTNNCDCELYAANDPTMPVSYAFAAAYEIDKEFVTHINITVYNKGRDSVSFADAYVRIDSRNVPYQYNEKFVPMVSEPVLPGSERTIALVGRAVPKTSDPWLAVAGEAMVVTVKGLKMGRHTLAEQVVTFVPRNPKLAP